jgi:hypothetical protein
MAEKLGEAVLELRTDDSGLNAGMARAKAGAQDLGNTFATAGDRAGRSLSGLTSSSAAAGAAASQMASQAQLSARAAVGLASGAETATVAVTGLGQGSALATRELLVLMREASRGNFTRMAGSASILTMALQGSGQSALGLVTNLLTMFGVLRTTVDAELAAEAAAASAAMETMNLVATKVAAKVAAADAELGLAEAAVRTAATSAEATAAQERLAAAHVGVAAAAGEAAIAEDALALSQGRAAEAQAAAAATQKTSLTGLGTSLGAVTAAAGLAYGGFKAFQFQVAQDGDLTRFRDSLGLTHAELLRLGDGVEDVGNNIKKLGPVTVTFGDVMHGVWDTIADHTGADRGIEGFKKFAIEQFELLLKAVVDIYAELYGDVVGTYRAIIVIWQNLPGAFGDIFIQAVNLAIGALDKLLKAGTDGINGFIHSVNSTLGTKIGDVAAPQIDQLTNQYAGAAKKVGSALHDQIAAATKEGRAQANGIVGEIRQNILDETKDRMQREADALKEDRKSRAPKKHKEKRNPADDELAKLDAEIAKENALTQAYLTGDAAVIKAEANQKALALALEKHATAAQTAALKQKELALAIATIAADGAKAISNLNADATARAKINAMVAAGLIPASQANQALQNELSLRHQVAALAVAQEDLAEARHAKNKKRIADDIAAIQRLQGIIKGLPASQAADDAAKNVADAHAQIAANDNEIAQLRLKNALLGDSNKEIATALANLQALQYLRDHPGIDASTAADLTRSYVDKATASIQTPFEQWAATVPQTGKAIGDAIENDAVKAIGNFNDGLAQAIVNGGNLFQVLHQGAASFLVDLIRLAEKEAEMALFKQIMGAVSGAAGAAGGGGGGGGFDFGSGGDGFGGGTLGETFSTSGGMDFGGFHAAGGMIPTGTFGIVGEKGPEPIISTPKGAMVLPNSSLRQGFAANDSAPNVSVTNYNDFRGADAQSVAAMQQRVDQMERDLPTRVVSTMEDMRTRLFRRA